MQLMMRIELRSDNGSLIAEGQIADSFREMLTRFLGPELAASPARSWEYLAGVHLPDYLAAPLPALEAHEPAPPTPGPDLAPAPAIAVDSPLSAAPAPAGLAPGAVLRVNVPGSPLHALRVRLREKWDLPGAEQWHCEILDGPDAGQTTTVYAEQCRPE